MTTVPASQSAGRNRACATIRAIHEPLVPWIWFGGGVVVIGAIIGIWPTRPRRTAVAAPVVDPVLAREHAA